MAEEGQLVGGRYQRVRTLGKGAYGLVVLAKDVESGEQVKHADMLLLHEHAGKRVLFMAAACEEENWARR